MKFLTTSYGNQTAAPALFVCELNISEHDALNTVAMEEGLDSGRADALRVCQQLPIAGKPGGLLQQGNRIIVSVRQQASVDQPTEDSLLVYRVKMDGQLVLDSQIAMPIFFSVLAPAHSQSLMLAASFHDGIDAVLSIEDEPKLLASYHHPKRIPGPDPRQQGPHPHWIGQLPRSERIFSVDLGTDDLYAYPDADKLGAGPDWQLRCPPATGPRLLVSRADGRIIYLLNELDNSITVFRRTIGPEQWEQIQQLSTLSADFTGVSSAAGFKLCPDDRFLLVSNRGENSLVLFTCDPMTGLLQCNCRCPTAATPRDFIWLMHPDHNQDAGIGSDYVVVFCQDGGKQGGLVQCIQLNRSTNDNGPSLVPLSASLQIPTPVSGCPLVY